MLHIYTIPSKVNNILKVDNFSFFMNGLIDTENPSKKWGGIWIMKSNYSGVQGYENYELYEDDQDLNTLNQGSGFAFAGNWDISSNYAPLLLSSEDFESYSNGQDVSTLDQGTGFDGAWEVKDNEFELIATDNFESYSAGETIPDGLNGGSGFDSAWVQ